jgi:hypothetical protein
VHKTDAKIDPDLAALIAAWPTLSERAKGRIVGLIESEEQS